MGTMIQASSLRDKNNLNAIPSDRPGYYKWWARKEQLDIILRKLELTFEKVSSELETREDWFCIYVGITTGKSLRTRLVRQHVKGNSKSSTLRWSIASIVGENMLDNEAVDKFIDTLQVEYFVSNNKIGSVEANEELHGIERRLLSLEVLYLLNIQENKHPDAPKKNLKALRKTSAQKVLK